MLLEVLQTTKTFLTSHSCLAVPNNYIHTPNKNGHLNTRKRLSSQDKGQGGGASHNQSKKTKTFHEEGKD